MSEKNEWKTVPVEPTPEILAAASLAAWPVASAADMELARKAARIVLMSMDAAPGSTLDSVAAAIATMAPAYRAMLAAAPAPSAPGDAQDERDDLIERLLDAQQDVNQIANETMSQTLCSVSALLDEIEVALRRQVPGPAPAAGDALQFLADTDGAIESLTLGGNTRYRVWWPYLDERQAEWFASPLEAVDAALAAQQGKGGVA